jgi:Tfp pilus assembly protein PilO
MTTQNDEDLNRWHLDKKVPITLLMTIVVQTVLGVVFLTKLDSRVARLEDDRHAQLRRDESQDNEARAAVAQLRSYLDRIDGKLDRLIERGQK